MDVVKELDAMRGRIGGCDLAAFVDLSSGMVLCTSADSAPAQEFLDALPEAAATLLQGPMIADVRPMAGGGDVGTAAVTITAEEVRVYVRSQTEAPEAMVLICPPEADVSATMDCARETLERIVSAEA